MIRVVPDTNIIISSIFWRGPPHRLIRVGIEGKCLMIISLGIINESTDRLSEKFEVPEDKIETELRILLEFCHVVNPAVSVNVVKDDPSDNKIIECALEGKADYIVTGDSHLLDLEEYGGIKIVTAKQMLEILGLEGV